MRLAPFLPFAVLACLGVACPAGAGEGAATIHVRIQVHGASAEALEREVARPLEEALADASDLGALEVTTRDGWVHATLGVAVETPDLLRRVGTRLSALEGPGRRVEVFEAAAPETLYLAFTSAHGEPDALAAAAREARVALARIPRVERVALHGAPRPELVIDLSPERIAARGLSVARVLEALDALAVEDPPVRVEDLEALRLGPETRLSDVAELRLVDAPPTTLCALDGAAAVVLALHVDDDARAEAAEALAAWSESHRAQLAKGGVEAIPVARDREVRVEFPEGTTPQRALQAAVRAVGVGRVQARRVLALAGEPEGPLPGAGTPVRLLLEAPRTSFATGGLLSRLAAEAPGSRVVAADGLASGWTLWLSSPDAAKLPAALHEATERLSRALPDARLAPAGVGRQSTPAFRLDEDRLAAHGLEKDTVERIVRAIQGGLSLSLRLAADGREVPVRLHHGGQARDPLEASVAAKGGAMVPLRTLGEAEVASRPLFPLRRQGRAMVALRILPPDPPSREVLAGVLASLREALPAGVAVELEEGTAFP